MKLHLQPQFIVNDTRLKITGSKSETNRLLLLQGLYPTITLENTSESDDSEVMAKAMAATTELIDIHHAGTAMRFLTAYFAIQEGREVTLTGSPRMKERPIKILVDALTQLGAEIQYIENEGFPPIRIKGKKITNNKVTLQANVSSQYISALLLIASKLENGLDLTLDGEITSVPYIKMTLALLKEIGIDTSFAGNRITVSPVSGSLPPTIITVESDWSSASYFYSIIALAKEGTELTLSSYRQNSLQGDSDLAMLYSQLGVDTFFSEDTITLKKRYVELSDVSFDLNQTPDIAQTIAVTCFGLNIGCVLTGLHTLKIKETDRLEALYVELSKLGAEIVINNDSLTLLPSILINKDIEIATYNDHRMAMAFAPLAIKVPILIQNAEVVSKSYPTYWKDLETLGFAISEMD